MINKTDGFSCHRVYILIGETNFQTTKCTSNYLIAGVLNCYKEVSNRTGILQGHCPNLWFWKGFSDAVWLYNEV